MKWENIKPEFIILKPQCPKCKGTNNNYETQDQSFPQKDLTLYDIEKTQIFCCKCDWGGKFSDLYSNDDYKLLINKLKQMTPKRDSVDTFLQTQLDNNLRSVFA